MEPLNSLFGQKFVVSVRICFNRIVVSNLYDSFWSRKGNDLDGFAVYMVIKPR